MRQKHDIDVLIEVNDDYVLLIEDKVNTKFHSGQLRKYAEIVEAMYSGTGKVIKKHYIKTYLTWLKEEEYVISEGYEIFNIDNFYTFFQHSDNIENDIFTDFKLNFQKRYNSYKSYKKIPPVKWARNAWYGFLNDLNKQLNYGKFGAFYSGTPYWFVVAWVTNHDQEKSHISLEFHTGRLVVKSHIKDQSVDKKLSRQNLRTELTSKLKEQKVKVKAVGGAGNTLIKANSMAVLELSNYFILDDNELIDFHTTCDRIDSISTLFNSKTKTPE